jgi:hypothetical protein
MSKIQQQSGSRREQQPCSASFVRLFQHRFADMVERGEKLQTVRKTPKRMPKPGDRISLRAWTEKPYRSKQRVLAEGTITEVSTVWLGWNALIVSDRVLTQAEWDAFARADGFADSVEMHGWFLKTHGIPVDGWRGILIRWQNDERVHHYQRRRTSITGLGL